MAFNPHNFLARHPLSLIGAWITTLCAILFLTGFAADLMGLHENPYLGIVFFLILPAGFVFGLVLIPIGIWLVRRRERRGLPPALIHWPTINLNEPRTRLITSIVAVATIINGLIVALAAYRGIEYMDSVAFCGQVCHEVMQPEFAAYQDGPHSRVTCVQCHIGPGAPWFVKSKLSGTRQVFAVTFNTFSRPIPAPVRDLRPARDTCEQCHWPEKFHGDAVDAVHEYASDETNTETTTTVRLHVGGLTARPGVATGIHWHVSRSNEIEYIALDEKRQTIGKVFLRQPSGAVREYTADGVTTEQLTKGQPRRRMDCMDCHNRPTHTFAASAARAVDQAIGRDAIPRTLPFIKREAVAALEATYPSRDQAVADIAGRLTAFYRGAGDLLTTRKADVDHAIAGTQQLYRRNMFPPMRIGWGTYPNNIGHTDFPGCFRCHDDQHKTQDGRVISQDCSLCHTLE